MYQQGKIWLASADGKQICLLPNMSNRHGLITGASGTGKTVTLKVIAEGFSAAGVPVFLADVKGDLAGMCQTGVENDAVRSRVEKFGITDWQYTSFPTRFWDVYGKDGHHLRATISDMGPLLLSELLGLSDVQSQVLNVVFKIADDNGLLLIDIKDLKAMLKYVADHKDEFTDNYGGMSPQSIAAIQRNLVSLESMGGDIFFSEPMLDVFDLFRTDSSGKGFINILHSIDLAQNKALYSAFMLWLLSEIYEKLPEAGDLEKPRAVFFFDEAHLIFNNAPAVLVDKIEQVIKLIRSKGVGIFFISQSPSDIPDTVLAQLSNKVQHALRAYTPKEQKAIRAAAESFRPNPAFKTEDAITELSTGEALISCLDETGAPSIAERAFILPPQSRMGTITPEERAAVISNSDLYLQYSRSIDNESAYEILTAQEKEEEAQALEDEKLAAEEKLKQKEAAALEKQRQKELAAEEKAREKAENAMSRQIQSSTGKIMGNTLSAAGRSIGRTAAKSITGKSSGLGGSIASTLMGSIGRELAGSITRGLFGSRK